ncbi:hypothetical protein OG313_42535 [Streptomyces virginiae]|nr:hypothetical protein [Streptomyces virginiae]MCX5174034.1 hypothetical protein [Streptomyces virginiae]
MSGKSASAGHLQQAPDLGRRGAQDDAPAVFCRCPLRVDEGVEAGGVAERQAGQVDDDLVRAARPGDRRVQGLAQHRRPLDVHLAPHMHDTALIVTVHPHALLTSLKIFCAAHDEAGWA